MSIELDHFFILTDPGAPQADLLSGIGLTEGTRNDHPGQGTANRRFFFSITALELVYVSDENEAANERGKEAEGVVDYSVLDGLGWSIYRQERVDEALQIFRRNLQLYAAEYIPNESLGDALWFSGDKAGGIAKFESWVERNPDNKMGRRRLLNMRDEI